MDINVGRFALRRRNAISAAVVLAALLVLVAGAGAGLYLMTRSAGASPSTTSTCQTLTTISLGSIQSTVTLPCGGGGQDSNGGGGGGGQQYTSSPSSSSTRSSSTTTTPTSTSTSSNTIETFHGHFTWSHTANFTSTLETMSASGTFTITIDLSQREGQGSGQGTLDDTITGICTGQSSTDYTFTVAGGINALTGNLTLGFGLATPGTGTTTETCPTSTSDHQFGFYSVAPIQVTLEAAYGASVQGNIGDTAYEITLA